MDSLSNDEKLSLLSQLIQSDSQKLILEKLNAMEKNLKQLNKSMKIMEKTITSIQNEKADNEKKLLSKKKKDDNESGIIQTSLF